MVTTKRNPDVTRKRLLSAAYDEIYLKGFRAASLEQILSATGLTKGALYHHFPNKAALGHAVISEIVEDVVLETWIRPFEKASDPVGGLIDFLRNPRRADLEKVCECGCPLNNLAQEMASIDDSFRRRLDGVYQLWRDRMAELLVRAQERGQIRKDVDCRAVGTFVVATIEGAASLLKTAQNPDQMLSCTGSLADYLESLKV